MANPKETGYDEATNKIKRIKIENKKESNIYEESKYFPNILNEKDRSYYKG